MNRPAPPLTPPPAPSDRARGIRNTTLVAISTNAVLSLAQLVVGVFSNAFSLVADAVHTLSDLVTDIMVLIAGRQGAEPADRNHPYGHGRIETAASMLLGIVLIGVGAGFLWSSGLRLQHMHASPLLHPAALYMALATLAAKEALFRFSLAAGKRLQAPMLEANAWHARSDAASSLVVAVGIGGGLAGYPFLEPLAAAVVGFLIVSMGAKLAWKAVRELIDTGVSDAELDELRQTILATPGVLDLHDLRTRRMADRILCDTHVLVDPRITVSEGHRISDAVYTRIRTAHPNVRDVLVHIDAEEDGGLQGVPPGPPPARDEINRLALELLGDAAPLLQRIQIHYLGQRIEIEIVLQPGAVRRIDADALKSRIGALLETRPDLRSVRCFAEIAPS